MVTDCTTEISGVSHMLKVIHSNQCTSFTRPVIQENEGYSYICMHNYVQLTIMKTSVEPLCKKMMTTNWSER